jgi:hypothetical protein
LNQELAHLNKAAELLDKYENKSWNEVVTAEFPKLLKFHDTRDYVRNILANQIELTADKEDFKLVSELPSDHRFFIYQNKINNDVNKIMSHKVIRRHQEKTGEDYRSEESPNPVEGLQDRTNDNTNIARKVFAEANN